MTSTKIFDSLKKCEDIQWSRAGCKIILKDGQIQGKIKIAFPKDGAGTLRLFLWDFENDIQMGTAGGFGYDKISAAMRGMSFKGITFTDHPHNWEIQLQEAGYQVITVM
jgi:hypothetical protein